MTNPHDIRDIFGAASGDEAFVCANGPSAALYEPDEIRRFGLDKLVIGCNDVWRVLRGEPLECDFFVILDTKFNEDHYKPIRAYTEMRDAIPVTHFEMDIRHMRVPLDMTCDSQLEVRKDEPAKFNPGTFFHGHSSGVAGVQLAMHMGVRRIFLLGHDLTVTPSRTHGFGDRHKERETGYQQGLTMRSGYDLLALHAQELGVEIINLSPISTLDQFPKRKEIPHGTAQAR